MNYLHIITMLLLLLSCNATLPLHIQENRNVEFRQSDRIYIETGSEIVKLSSRLKREMVSAGFAVTDQRKDAWYVLAFDYSAEFSPQPWVFRSFNLELSDTASGGVLYTVMSGSSPPESVDSVIKRAVNDMAQRL